MHNAHDYAKPNMRALGFYQRRSYEKLIQKRKQVIKKKKRKIIL